MAGDEAIDHVRGHGDNDAQRECVQLVFLEGMALAEIAEVQKVPEGTVKTRLFHGRRNLRDCVERRMRR